MSKQMSKFAIVLCIFSSGAIQAGAQAQESLFIAKVERITLEPRGGQYCPERCAGNGHVNSNGTTQVCISNDGGCERTEYVVSKVLLGDVHLGANKVDTRTGEWGGTDFPITNQPILVHMKPGAIEWVPIIVKDGQQRADVKAFRHGILDSGIALRTLAQNGEDSVSIDSLVERISLTKP